MSRDCLPSIPKPRKRSSLTGLTEPEVNGVPLPHVAHNNVPTFHTPGHSAPFDPVRDNRHQDALVDALLARPDVKQNGSWSFASLFARGLGLANNSQEPIEALKGIDCSFVRDSFAAFSRMASRSPFLDLPDTDVLRMVTRRPVTSLAACIVARAADTFLQPRLVKTFRQILASKVFMEGEKSVDLMHGLLIHIAWHHHYMSKAQVHELMYLVAGMASDHGLYRQHLQNIVSAQLPDGRTQLLFLESYYICTALAGLGSESPSPLPWSENLSRIALRSHLKGTSHDADEAIPLIELARTLGHFDSTIRESSRTHDIPSQPCKWSIWHNSESELKRLTELAHRIPSLASESHFHAARLNIYTIVLQNGMRVDAGLLTNMAVGVKDYFDIIFSRHATALADMSIVTWTNLLFVLAALTLIHHPKCESLEAVPGALRGLLETDSIFDALTARLSAAVTHENWLRCLVARIRAKVSHAPSRGRTGSGEVSESEARFRPVNAGPGISNEANIGRRGSGVCEVDVGRVCKLHLLEDEFWDRLLSSF